LAAAQERDRQDRVQFEDWSKGLFARLAKMDEMQGQLLIHQSQRIDRMDRIYDRMDRIYERSVAQGEQMLDLQRQALHLLNLILDRLPPAPPGTA
jgi:hypothetical protein